MFGCDVQDLLNKIWAWMEEMSGIGFEVIGMEARP